MKILKYAGIVLVALVSLFLSLGLLFPFFEYSSMVIVNAGPEKCWAVLHDTSRMKKWVPGFQQLTLISGEHMRVGAKYEIVVRQDELYLMREMVKEIREPELVAFELKNDVMKSEYDFSLTPKGSQTEITSHYRITGNNLIWKSMLFLSQSLLQSGSQQQLDLLKSEIESGV